MMCKGVSLLLPERSLKTLEGKKHLLQQRKKKVNYQVGRVSLSVWAFCFSNKSCKNSSIIHSAAYHMGKALFEL